MKGTGMSTAKSYTQMLPLPVFRVIVFVISVGITAGTLQMIECSVTSVGLSSALTSLKNISTTPSKPLPIMAIVSPMGLLSSSLSASAGSVGRMYLIDGVASLCGSLTFLSSHPA